MIGFDASVIKFSKTRPHHKISELLSGVCTRSFRILLEVIGHVGFARPTISGECPFDRNTHLIASLFDSRNFFFTWHLYCWIIGPSQWNKENSMENRICPCWHRCKHYLRCDHRDRSVLNQVFYEHSQVRWTFICHHITKLFEYHSFIQIYLQ